VAGNSAQYLAGNSAQCLAGNSAQCLAGNSARGRQGACAAIRMGKAEGTGGSGDPPQAWTPAPHGFHRYWWAAGPVMHPTPLRRFV